jgi:hypothetical protein
VIAGIGPWRDLDGLRETQSHLETLLPPHYPPVSRPGQRTVGDRYGGRPLIGGLPGIVEQHSVLLERGPDHVSPFFIPSVLVDSASGQIAISLGLRGPNYAPVSA